MAQAWQVRKNQRKKLIEKLEQRIFFHPRTLNDEIFFYFELATLLMRKQIPNAINYPYSGQLRPNASMLESFLNSRIVRPLMSFGRTPAERHKLLGMLLLMLINRILDKFNEDLVKQETLDPRSVFCADRDEELPDNDSD